MSILKVTKTRQRINYILKSYGIDYVDIEEAVEEQILDLLNNNPTEVRLDDEGGLIIGVEDE
jgi:hypothetical protein